MIQFFRRRSNTFQTLFVIAVLYVLIKVPYNNVDVSQNVLPFKHRNETANLNCQYYLTTKDDIYDTYKKVSLQDPEDLPMTCDDIRTRQTFIEQIYPEEEHFPLAFVKVAFKDYLFLESELAANYNPDNVYAYVLDSKCDPVFENRIRQLASCFKNIVVSDNKFDMFSDGRNIAIALYDGLKTILDRTWKYVMLLENYDVMIKTNYELIKILETFEGANDVGAVGITMIRDHRRNYVLRTDWSFKKLGIIPNLPKELENQNLTVSQSIPQALLTYEAVHYIFNDLNITNFLLQSNGTDMQHEYVTSTLNNDEKLGVPGGYTTKCLGLNRYSTVTRYCKWLGSPNYKCLSRTYRHHNCILGMWDLPNLVNAFEFAANKMVPSFDYGGIGCWHEYIFNKQHVNRPTSVDVSRYHNLPTVRWNRLKKLGKTSEFVCYM